MWIIVFFIWDSPLTLCTYSNLDAGKSTIGGQMMYLTGMVDKRTLEKYEREAKEKNRETWYLSWCMDTNQEGKHTWIELIRIKIIYNLSILVSFSYNGSSKFQNVTKEKQLKLEEGFLKPSESISQFLMHLGIKVLFQIWLVVLPKLILQF